jgi:hypothetical protein
MIQKNLIHKKWDQIKIIFNKAMLKKKKKKNRDKILCNNFFTGLKKKSKGNYKKMRYQRSIRTICTLGEN